MGRWEGRMLLSNHNSDTPGYQLQKQSPIRKTIFEAKFLLRGSESNRQSSGYEPDELPLLYPAMIGQFCHE